MTFHIKRWNYPESKGLWYQEIQKMRTFFYNRPVFFEEHMKEYFSSFKQIN